MSNKLIARKKKAIVAKVKKIGSAGLGTSLLIGTSPALANGAFASFANAGAGGPGFTNNLQHHATTSILAPTVSPIQSSGVTARGHNSISPTNSLFQSHRTTALPTTAILWQNHASAGAFSTPTAQQFSLGGATLDLQSANHNIVLGVRLFNGASSATINVGGVQQTYSPGQHVTAAEYVAITEVVGKGTQTLSLDSSGIAIGGNFSINATASAHASTIVIPTNVTAFDNLTTSSSLSLKGDLLNYGSIYTYSTSSATTSGTISAHDIVNESSGLISAKLPTALMAAVGGVIEDTSVTISASNNLTNSGLIIGTGSLSLAAGSGQITNSGTVQSLHGDINLTALQPNTNIFVQATGGSFQAQNGDINVRQAAYAGGANVTLAGGDYLSRNLNIYSGSGSINGVVNNVTGQLNTQAAVEHLNANSANLILGHNTVDGDPTFVNSGNIIVSGVNTFTEDVTIIANGNITADSTGAIVDHGHDVTLLAGVAPGAGTPNTSTITSGSTGITGSTTVDFTAAGNKGGNIDFTQSTAATVIDTTGSNSNGGNVTLAAFANGATGGNVSFASTSTINTSALPLTATPGQGGNVTVIAGAAPSTASATVSLGNVTTNGGWMLGSAKGGTGGAISVTTAQPIASIGTTVTFDQTGAITSGNSVVAATNISNNAQVTAGVLQTAFSASKAGGMSGGSVIVHAGSNVSATAIQTNGTNGQTYSYNGSLISVAGGNAGNIALTSDTGAVSVSGAITSAGGAGANGASGNFGTVVGGSAGGAGAVITVNAPGTISLGNVVNNGGIGGDGINAGFSPTPQAGVSGGSGGNGGSLTVESKTASVSVGDINTSGGPGGKGGSGGQIAGPSAPPGAGGKGGVGGGGGAISLISDAANVTVAGNLNTSGGNGGVGGAGGNGGQTGPSTGFPGAVGGLGGSAGSGGAITTSGQVQTISGGYIASGGSGGSGGTGGSASAAQIQLASGNGGKGGDAGSSGNVSEVFNNFAGQITTNAGTAGQGGAAGTTGIPSGTSGASGALGAAGDVSLTGVGTISNAISGKNITIQAPSAGNGSIIISAPLTASNSLTLKAAGSGALTVGSTALTAQQFTLITGSGNLSSLNLNASTAGPVGLTLVAPGTVNVALNAPINLIATSSAGTGQPFAITANGGINVNSGATVNGGAISLTNSGSTGGITQSDALSTSTLNAPTIVIANSGSGLINLSTVTKNLTLSQGSGAVTLQNVGSLTLNANLNVSNFSLNNLADAAGNGAIKLAGGTTISATNNVTLASSQSGAGTGGISQADNTSTVTVTAKSLSLSDSGNGDLILTTKASAISAATGGAVQLNNFGAVTLMGVSAGGLVNINNQTDASGNGAITVGTGTTVSGSTVQLASSESGQGTGGITQQDALTTATVSASNIQLYDNQTGNVAGSGNAAIVLGITGQSTPIVNAVTSGAISLQSPVSIQLNGASGSNVSVVSTGGGITVTAAVTANQNINLTASGNNDVAIQKSLTSLANGVITIISADFNIGSGITIDAGKGTIALMPTGNQTIGLADPTGSTFGQFNISTSQIAQLTASNLSVGNASTSGALQVLSNVTTFGGGVSLNSASSVAISANTNINAANITVSASDFILPSTASLNTGTTGTVTLAPSGNQTIGLADPTGSTFGAFNISQTELNSITAATLNVGSATSGGDLQILGNVSQFATALNIASAGNIITTNGVLQSNAISLISGAASIGSSSAPVLTATASLAAQASGNVYISNSGGVSLNTSSAGSANTFSVVTTPDATENGWLAIAPSAVISAGTVSLSSSENSGGSGGITGGSSTLSAIKANTILLSDHLFATSTDLGSGTGSGAFTVTVGDGQDNVKLSAVTQGAVAISVSAPQISVNLGNVILGASVSITGISALALSVVNQGQITALTSTVTIASASGQELDISGVGTITAPTGGAINLTATDNAGVSDPNLVLRGNPNFAFSGSSPNGTVNFNASGNGQSVVVKSGATVTFTTDNTTGILNTQTLLLNGAFNLNNPPLTGNKLVLNAGNAEGVIANSTGSDLNLSTLPGLTFNGKDLTIISAGNIIDGGSNLTIDLSNGAGNGGQLSILAGFNFSPSTAGTDGPSDTSYSISGRGTGNVSLANTSILTNGSANGGAVLLVANGTVALNSVNTVGSNSSGNVTIIGSGITVSGAINTSNNVAASAGAINIDSGTNTNTGNLIIISGRVTGGVISPGVAGGNIALGSITTNSNSVNLLTGASGQITASGVVNSGTLNLVAGSGGIGASLTPMQINTPTLTATAGTAGAVFLQDAAATVSLVGSNTAGDFNLSSSNTNGSMVVGVGATLVATSHVELVATGSGTITMADAKSLIQTPSLQLLSAGGAINVATNATSLSAQSFNGLTTIGDVTIVDSATSAVTLAANSSNHPTDNIAAHYSLTTPNASITLGAGEQLKGSSSVTLISSGSIDAADATAAILTPTLNLQATGGNIGATNAISSNATALTASAYNGNATSPAYGTVALKDTAATVALTANKTLGIDNIGSTFALTASGAVTLVSGEQLTGQTLVSIISGGGSIDAADSTALVKAPTLILGTAGGAIGATNAITTTASLITAHASDNVAAFGNVNIHSSAAKVTLAKDASSGLDNTGNTFQLTNTNANGSIVLAANENVVGKTAVVLIASGTGTIDMVNTSGQISAPNITLVTGGGAIGATNAVTTSSTNLTAYASNGSSVFGNVNVTGVAGTTITLVKNVGLGLVNTGATFTVNDTNGSIVIGAGGSVVGNASIKLNASGTGSISQTDDTASLNTPVLTLIGHGGIGSSANAPIVTNTATLSADGGTAGNVFVQDSGSSVLLAGTSAGNNFVVTMTNPTSGGITISNNLTITGTTSLQLSTSGAGAVTVGSFAKITAPTVFIHSASVINNGTIAATTGTLAFDNNGGDIAFSSTSANTSYVAPTALTISASGTIDIGGIAPFWQLSHGTNVLFVAGGDIINSSTANAAIAIFGNNSQGGSVNMIAGAKYAYGSDANTLNLTGASTSGGSVKLGTAQGLTEINAQGFGGPSGSVTIVALAGTKSGTGIVDVSGMEIDTGNEGTGANGNITLIGGNTDSSAAIINKYTIVNGLSGAPVLLAAASPTISGASFSKGLSQGTPISFSKLTNGNISFGNISAAYGSATVESNGGLLSGNSVAGHQIFLLTPAGQITTTGNITAVVDSKDNGGSIEINGALTYGQTTISADGVMAGNGGSIKFDSGYSGSAILSAQGGNGGGNGGTVTILNPGGLAVAVGAINVSATGGDGSGGTITITASAGSLNLSGDLHADSSGAGNGGNITLTGANTNGINITTAISAAGTGGQVQISNTAGGLSTSQTVVADKVTLSADGGDIGSSTTAFAVNANQLTVNTDSNAYVSTTNNALALDASSVTKNFVLSGTTALEAAGNTTVGGSLTLNFSSITVGKSVTVQASAVTINGNDGADLQISLADSTASLISTGSGGIAIVAPSGQNLQIANAGLIQALSGDINISATNVQGGTAGNVAIGGGGIMQVGSGTITISANIPNVGSSANNVEFTGSQIFKGNTVINAVGPLQQVIIDDAATVSGNSTVTLNTNILTELGSGTISGNPLVLNSAGKGGIIASTAATLDLSTLGSLVFNGQSLVIISSGSITDSSKSVTIDLSNSGDYAGKLSILAGFSFTPAPSGGINYPPLDTTDTYNVTGSLTGSINLAHTTINTSGGKYGGNVLAVANGSIALGSITTKGGVQSGSVNIIGEGVTDSGTINTSATGQASAGNVSITSATPVINGSIILLNGFVAGGTFTAGAVSGKVLLNSVNANGAQAGAIAITTGNSTVFNIGSTAKTNVNGVTGSLTATGNNGSISIVNAGGGITNTVGVKNVTTLSETAGTGGTIALGSVYSKSTAEISEIDLTVDTGKITETGSVTAPRMTLKSTGGNIGTASVGLNVATTTLEVDAAGLANVKNTSTSGSALVEATVGSSLKVVSAGSIDVTGNITAGTDVTLQAAANHGGISINGNITGSTSSAGKTSLIAGGKDNILTGTANYVVAGASVVLKTTTGLLGLSGSAINVSTTNLTETSTGATYLNTEGDMPLTFNGSNSQGAFSLTSSGTTTVTKIINQAKSIVLDESAGSNGGVNILASIGGSKTTLLVVDADGTGSISAAKNAILTVAKGGSIALSSGKGDIGTGNTATGAIKVSGGALSFNTSRNGEVNINDSTNYAHEIFASQAGGSLYIKSATSTSYAGLKSLNDSVTAIVTSGTSTVIANAQVLSGNGPITLEAANAGNGKIVINANAVISSMSTSTTGGQVNIVIGAVPAAPVVGTAPANVVVNQITGGSVYFGKNGITAEGGAGVNTLNLQGSNIVFNTGTRPNTAISLGGNVTITADPVLTSAAQPTMIASADLVLVAPQIRQAGETSETGVAVGPLSYTSSLAGQSLSPSNVVNAAATNLGQSNLASRPGVFNFFEPGWISETELSSGEIPATVSGIDLGFKNEVSSILEFGELGGSETSSSASSVSEQVSVSSLKNALSGVVTKDERDNGPVSAKVMRLRRGSVVLAPSENTIVRTGHGDVKVASGCVVLIIAFEQGVAVYNLFDAHSGAVSMVTSGKTLSSIPGHVVVVTHSGVKNFAEINPAQTIGCANLQTRSIDAQHTAFVGQFSLPHALNAVLPLRKLVSSNSPNAQKLSARLIKTAAILSQIGAVQYQQIVRPVATASLR